MSAITRPRRSLLALAAVAALALTATGTAAASARPAAGAAPAAPAATAASANGAFYHYSGATPLARIAPGTVLKTRTVAYHIQGLTLPLEAIQLLYRTRTQLGAPTVNVTSVIRPIVAGDGGAKLVSYQSAYDSLNPDDEPSVAIDGGTGLGKALGNAETALFVPLLLAGYTVNVPDTEGQTAAFADGPLYGTDTLDSLRAASNSAVVGVGRDAPIGMLGYSGGAIATEWAAELAANYAPDIAPRLVGSAIGGVLVDPDHNLHYIEGTSIWAGVLGMALIGAARGFQVDLTPYANAYGRALFTKLQHASIAQVLGQYPGLTWSQIAKAAYPQPEDVPLFVKLANQLIMGTGGTPNAPMYIGQGTGGELEGTPGDQPGIGAGDGVMIAGDVRTLARTYCSRGVTVDYQQYTTSHTTSLPQWTAESLPWLQARFDGTAAPSSCGSIPAGNSLKPVSTGR